jgi:Fe-S-cluster-containing hydrogenase component 2
MDMYEKLRQILDTHPSGAPKSEAFDKILRLLFTPEEVEIALGMNFSPRPVEEIAEEAGLPVEKAEKLLEAMADKVVIFGREKDGKKQYGLVPTIPGLFEFPFMKGGGTPLHEELGRLWEEYHHEALGKSFAGTSTPLMRVVPVETSLSTQSEILPYQEVRDLVDEASYIAVTECACRVSVNACDKPRDVCMVFGSPAKFLVERGYAREIDTEEAYRVLERAEEAGLVHTSNNSADRGNLICNCCPCCCTVLRGRTQLDIPNAFATSAYVAEVNPEACTACGVCADERCPMDAIEVAGDFAVVTPEKCIGCGVCVSTCSAEALKLVERTDRPDISPTVTDMAVKILTEKGKLEEFMEVMKK